MPPERQAAVRVLHQVQRAGYTLEPDGVGGLLLSPGAPTELQTLVHPHHGELLAMFRAAGSPATRLDVVPTGHPHAEGLAIAVRAFPKLPAPSTLWLRVDGVPTDVVWTTSRERYAACAKDRVPAFHAKEFLAATVAAEMSKAYPRDLRQWCETKADNPSWRLTEAFALAGDPATSDAPSTLWRALGLLGAELLDAVVEVPGEGLAKAEPAGESDTPAEEGRCV